MASIDCGCSFFGSKEERRSRGEGYERGDDPIRSTVPRWNSLLARQVLLSWARNLTSDTRIFVLLHPSRRIWTRVQRKTTILFYVACASRKAFPPC